MMSREELLAHYARVRAHYRALAPAYSREANQTCEGRYRDIVQRVIKEHKLAAFARMVTFEPQLAPARGAHASVPSSGCSQNWIRSPIE